MSLSGHTAFITGAGQGIGKACALAFASRGANLVLIDKNQESLTKVASEVSNVEGMVTQFAFDLTDLEELKAIGERDWKKIPIDILVNNAGFDRPGTTAKIDRKGLDEVFSIHVTVPLMLIQLFLPYMQAAGWGRIINISSIYGLIGGKGEVAYSSAKAGVIGLTKSVAKECGEDGVTVNAVLPGLIRTPTIERFMAEKYKQQIIADTALGRIGEPEEIARVVAFLASEDASFITGIALPVSGGWGVL
ncbi:MAG: SDR family oxidoreductase [Deltaproteobacteria bacterium]|nr:MAG: SDR family oxidoreductase [Deltaproteobacteria bacterium]